MYDPGVLPRQLKRGREYRNYSQQGIADALDVHVTSYNKWELGKNQPNAVDLARVANAMEIDVSFFFVDSEDAKRYDLRLRDERDEIERMRESIENLQKLVKPQTQHDPVIAAVENNELLRKLVQATRNIDDMKLQRVVDKVETWLEAMDEIQKGDSISEKRA